jgi:predicted phosphoribosyltransferase
LFHDRHEAGRLLARRLGDYAGRDDVIVLALPRGGVPVGREVARALRAPLDVFVVRKLGVPGHEELAMGAIASGGVEVLNDDVVRELGLDAAAIAPVAREEHRELARREALYRAGLPDLDLRGKIAIVVDDGLATGTTMLAALTALRRLGPRRIVVAVPVGAETSLRKVREAADEAVCAFVPSGFFGIGQFYEDFSQTSDEEVRRLLDDVRHAVA